MIVAPPEQGQFSEFRFWFLDQVVAPVCISVLANQSIAIQSHQCQLVLRGNGLGIMLVDLLLLGERPMIVLVDVLMTIEMVDVQSLFSKLEDLRYFLPHYAHYDLYGMLYGMTVTEPLSRFIMDQGLFLLLEESSERLFRYLNPPEFLPRQWNRS
ncbi:MAG: hypothetical protein HQL58_13990 [Magnetococcales bacterium]|nr:hypothetical protein [Magnetococcales bacterium]